MMQDQAEPVYRVRDLAFSYRNTEVLRDVNLEIVPGRFYGLIGPNGSGKTTLIELLTAGAVPGQGIIELSGRPLGRYSKKELARRVALVPQQFATGFDFTVSDLVLMGRYPFIPRFGSPTLRDLQLVEEAMASMQIVDLRHRLLGDLSGGERQRVVVARALAQDTEVLVLDEATSSLDIHHAIEIMHVIRKRVRKEGRTVIAAIHDLNLASAFCDEVIVLRGGRVYATGPVREVMGPRLLAEVFQVGDEVQRLLFPALQR